MRTKYSAAAVIAMMKAIVEAPGYQFLQHYKEDFYNSDVATISEVFGPQVQYLWIVRPNGTYLTRLGVHAKQNEHALTTYECGVKATAVGVEAYLVSELGVRKVTLQQIQDLMKCCHYVLVEKTVRVAGEIIAGIDVRRVTKPGNGNHYVHAVLQSPCLERLTVADLGALRDIAAYEGVALWSSFFVQVEVLTINGQDLNTVIETRKAPAPSKLVPA